MVQSGGAGYKRRIRMTFDAFYALDFERKLGIYDLIYNDTHYSGKALFPHFMVRLTERG